MENALPIYLDYHATTPTDPRVADVVLHYMTRLYGNANSGEHIFGDQAEEGINVAREHIALLLDASPRDIIFTSGATESINLAIQGLLKEVRAQGISAPLRIGLLPVEHHAVLDTCVALAEVGEATLTFFSVDNRARLDLEDYEAKCRSGLDLVCVMAANNEVGTLYPIREAAHIAHENGALFFTDATQAAGKVAIRFEEWGIDMLAMSGHKMYGPKGVGALLVAPGIKLRPLIYGGGHQRGLRSGTLNVPGIVGLGEACRLRELEMGVDEPRIATLRDHLQDLLQQNIPNLVVNGDTENRLAGNLHISIPGIQSSALVARLRNKVALSTGSACSSGIEASSHVLRAMGLSRVALEGSLRAGLGKFTDMDALYYTIRQLMMHLPYLHCQSED